MISYTFKTSVIFLYSMLFRPGQYESTKMAAGLVHRAGNRLSAAEVLVWYMKNSL
ncbi:MAG: hypothetical protein GQ469_04920 [Methanosarcinales archaeon]|nr:hypothetical protein [Methanosarcinales archaeon]